MLKKQREGCANFESKIDQKKLTLTGRRVNRRDQNHEVQRADINEGGRTSRGKKNLFVGTEGGGVSIGSRGGTKEKRASNNLVDEVEGTAYREES